MRGPYATFSHGPENEEDMKIMSNDDKDKFYPRTRAEIIESDAFRNRFGDHVRDNLEDEQLAIVALYLSRNDSAEAGRYLSEILKPRIAHVVKSIKEDDLYNGSYVYDPHNP